jgi:hypothetical protein
MPFLLKAYRNYDWVPLPRESFADYREARTRAAVLLRVDPAEMIAVFDTDRVSNGKMSIAACLTTNESRGARPTEWPGVWEWGPSGKCEAAPHAAGQAATSLGAPAA